MAQEEKIRQPIVTVCGHVDHGKTSILDSLRGSSVQDSEAGGITQKISFSLFPKNQLEKACPLIKKAGLNLSIPGFLFIDTPGHAAFTNLRKRGGSLADLAVLVIDINEGIKPQTAEVIQILKHNKTPFIIALNKIDNIHGWRSDKDKELKDSIESQPLNVKQNFDEKYLTLIGSLQSHGFDADLFYNISDFRKKIALVPCSAKTKQGIQELIMVLCGLSQKYLIGDLATGKTGKGVVLEIKKEKEGSYLESILYDGIIKKGQEIAISNLTGDPHLAKIRVLEEIQPLSIKFKPVENALASTGLRIQIAGSKEIDVLPGMPFIVHENNLDKIRQEFKKELSESLSSKVGKTGIIAKADSLGSLEALLVLLEQHNIPVVKAGIGKIGKQDIASAKANLEINELDSVIIGFNTVMDDEAKLLHNQNRESIKVITDEVIYKLIENLVAFRQEKANEIEKKRLMSLAPVAKLKLLKQYVFKNTSPAIFGVKIEAGKLVPGLELIDEQGEKVGRVKNLQEQNKAVSEAGEGKELAISIPGINYERRMANKDINFLYSNISESQFRSFRKNRDLLSQSEIRALQEIAEIKRKNKVDWGA